MIERKGKGQQSRPKPYSAPADKGKQRLNDERRPNRRDAPTEIVCFKCGEKGHKSNVCGRDEKKCFRCGQKGHTLADCKRGDVVCYNCNEEGCNTLISNFYHFDCFEFYLILDELCGVLICD